MEVGSIGVTYVLTYTLTYIHEYIHTRIHTYIHTCTRSNHLFCNFSDSYERSGGRCYFLALAQLIQLPRASLQLCPRLTRQQYLQLLGCKAPAREGLERQRSHVVIGSVSYSALLSTVCVCVCTYVRTYVQIYKPIQIHT